MCRRLLVPAVLLLAAGPAAADPPVVFQTLPAARFLADARAVIRTVVGEKEAKEFDAELKKKLGAEGYAGLDLTRPILGYVLVGGDPSKATVVVAVPVTGEKEFLGFFKRATGVTLTAGAGGLYSFPEPTAKLRFANGHAYVAVAAADPAAELAPDKLVAPDALYDPADPAHVSLKVHLDRLDPAVRKSAGALLAQAKAAAEKATGMNASPVELIALGGLGTADRLLKHLDDAKTAAIRLSVDTAAVDLTAELTVVPKAGGPLSVLLAAARPTTNRFAGLLTPDTAGGFVVRLPFFNDELKAAGLKALADAENAAGFAGPGADLVREALKAAGRAVKSGEADLAGAMRGPDKNGRFTLVAAAALPDPSGIEKELKRLVENDAPPEFRQAVKWNADKAGAVPIHVLDFGQIPDIERGGDGAWAKVFGGAAGKAAMAFAPQAVYLAIGPDAVAAVKAAAALPPGPAPVLDVMANPGRIKKLMTTAGAPPREVDGFTQILGSGDRPVRLAALTVDGGADLKVTARLSLRMLVGFFGARAHATFEPVAPPPPPPPGR